MRLRRGRCETRRLGRNGLKKERRQLTTAELARIISKSRRRTTEMFSLAVTGVTTVTKKRRTPPLRVPQLRSTAVPDTLRNSGWGHCQKTGNSGNCGDREATR